MSRLKPHLASYPAAPRVNRRAAISMCAALLAALAPLAHANAQTTAATVAAPVPAPESYTAETTYAKLAKDYPFIRIAGRAVPATVRAVENITYVRRGTHALQLDLYLPAAGGAGGAGPAPAIVLVHGGGWRAGLRSNLAPLAIRLAERGYAAATISYRLSPEAAYPAAVLDAKAAVRWMRARGRAYGIDTARIAIGGASAGGQIASLAGVTADRAIVEPAAAVDPADAATAPGTVSSAVQAIVNIDGLSDFTSAEARRYEDDPAKQPSSAGAWFGGRYAQKEALWREASPLFHVTRATPPILFIGSAQPRFSLGREAMIAKMTALGIPSRVAMVADTPHSFWLFDPWLAPTVEATAAFLDKYLRGADR